MSTIPINCQSRILLIDIACTVACQIKHASLLTAIALFLVEKLSIVSSFGISVMKMVLSVSLNQLQSGCISCRWRYLSQK